MIGKTLKQFEKFDTNFYFAALVAGFSILRNKVQTILSSRASARSQVGITFMIALILAETKIQHAMCTCQMMHTLPHPDRETFL